MGRNDRWKNGWELVLILALIYAVSAEPTCREGQKRRDVNDLVICCYTARCNKSQKFEFCKQDQGRDICVNCPPGTYTNDKINTAQWDEESDFCVPIPLCNSDEVILVGNECVCNLAKGYWGVDSNNCKLDSNSCRSAGHQLRQKDGFCIRCDEDKFKPENGTYGVCQNKTKCKADEEEVDGRSPERDRKCQAIQIDTTSTLAPPTITTNTEPPNEENVNDDEKSIIVWLLPVCGSVALICVAVCLWWKCRIRIQELFGNLCCQRRDATNRSENQEFQHMNGILVLQNRNTNGREKQPFLDSLRNGHATGTDEADTSQTLAKSVPDSEQPLLDPPISNGHATGTDEADSSETLAKSIVGKDEQYPSLPGESIFDNDKNSSLEQNEESLIGTQMSAASNSKMPVIKTSRGNANNTGGNSIYDTARTGSTLNFPNSDLFHSLNTTGNTTQHQHIGEVTMSKAGNTEAPINIIRPMATESRVTGNTEPPTNNPKPIAAASRVTGNTQPPTKPVAAASRVTGNTQPPTKPVAAVRPFPIPQSSTSSQSQENTAPDNNDQGFPASPTTVGGIDIETAVNERNSKLVCSAPYPYDQPSHVNMPPEEPSESLDDYVAAGGSSRNDDSILTTDDGNRYLPLEETSESLDDNGSGLRTLHGNPLAAPESTSTTSSNEPSLPSVESENPGQYN